MTYNFVTYEEIDQISKDFISQDGYEAAGYNFQRIKSICNKLLAERDAYREGWIRDRVTIDQARGRSMQQAAYMCDIDAESARLMEDKNV